MDATTPTTPRPTPPPDPGAKETLRWWRVLTVLLDVRQWKSWLSAYVVRRDCSLRNALGVRRRMRLKGLPWHPGGHEVWAVTVVRNEVDIIESSVRHMFDQGIDGLIVCDHQSTDGTHEVLTALASKDSRIYLTSDAHPGHFQAERITRLAERAWWAGARWVIPFDADEFWYAKGRTMAEMLGDSSAMIVQSRVHNLVPAEPTSVDAPRARYYRLDPKESVPKVAFRAHPLAIVGPGNHGVNLRGSVSTEAVIAHLPYRSVQQASAKFRTGSAALDAMAEGDSIGWHWRAGAAMSPDDLEAFWQAFLAGEPIPDLGWTPGPLGAPRRWLAAETWPWDVPERT